MAAAVSFAAFFPPAVTATGKPAIRSPVAAALPSPPAKFTRRQNYLRRKLLRTLTKPSPKTLTPSQIPAESPEVGDQEFDFDPLRERRAQDSDNLPPAKPGFDVEESEGSNLVEDSVPEDSVVVEASDSGSGLGRVSARTVVRYGVYVVGLLLVQAIVSAFVMGSADNDKRKNRRRRGEGLGLNGNGDLNGNDNSFLGKFEMKNGSLLYIDEAEMEAKIAEIRMMAREAKEREKSNLGAGDSGSNDLDDVSDDEEDDGDSAVEDDSSRVRSGIEREINGRLTRVRRSLDTVRENSPVMNVNFLNKPEQEAVDKGKRNTLGEKEEDRMLMFEKKHKFRSSSGSKPSDKPKGFQGSDRIGRNGSVSEKDTDLLSKTPSVAMQSSDIQRGASKILDRNDVKETTEMKESVDESMGVDLKREIEENADLQSGNVQDSNAEKTMDKRTQLRMPKNVDEDGKATVSKKHVVPKFNGGSRARRVGSTESTSRGDNKETDDDCDLWWLSLPCLFAVAMQQGSKDEGERGFYALKTTCDDPSRSQTSYTVLFENHVDAQNFSHLLESFFEEMEDIIVFVTPLPIKELNVEVKSQTRKVIVVRKGQVKLYAGQPLDEVETALRALVK